MRAPETVAYRAAEEAARSSYGRLVAFLAARAGDLAAAEDALGDAFRAALERWPVDGIPERREAWLLTAARRRLIDGARHARVRADAAVKLRVAAEAAEQRAWQADAFPDERLRLLFACAHPALDPGIRTPLLMRSVLGIDAARIASAFLVAPTAMRQRLVRAKAKIRDAGIRFDVPDERELPERLDAVLEAIYAAYGSARDPATAGERGAELGPEAIWLARTVVALLPAEPEPHGLLALVLYCESRRAAGRGPDGAYVPLAEQDTALWSADLIQAAERELRIAARARSFGRFQLEAAIQSVHAARAVSGVVDGPALVRLYDALLLAAPTLGARVGRAAALAQAGEAPRALAALDELRAESVVTYQTYWAVRAHVLAALGQTGAARTAYGRAIGLTQDPATREFLLRRSHAL